MSFYRVMALIVHQERKDRQGTDCLVFESINQDLWSQDDDLVTLKKVFDWYLEVHVTADTCALILAKVFLEHLPLLID